MSITKGRSGDVNYQESSEAVVFDLDMNPLFNFYLYGVDHSRLCSVYMVNTDKQAKKLEKWADEYPVGGEIIRRALKRRGLHPDNFMITAFQTAPIENHYLKG